MKQLLLALGFALVLAGCASEPEQAANEDAPERDGFSGQMGVMAGDPSDYGD